MLVKGAAGRNAQDLDDKSVGIFLLKVNLALQSTFSSLGVTIFFVSSSGVVVRAQARLTG